jgi:phage FluMu gp28-like protein
MTAPALPPVLLPYQARVVGLLDDSATRVLVVEKSRRIGLTWALAAAAVLRAGRARGQGGMDALYIAYSREMTREFVDAAAMWARALDLAAGAAEEVLFADGPDRSVQAFRILFASGFEVLALSSAPRNLRGKQGLCVIDEAAFLDALPEVTKAALAFLMWGGQVVLCSTHNGADNPFAELVADVLAGRRPYAHLRVTLDDALADGLYRRICLVSGRDWSAAAEEAWRAKLLADYGEAAEEELFCVPTRGSGVWLPAALIEARMTAPAPVPRLDLPADFLHLPPERRQALLAPFEADLGTALDGLPKGLRMAFGFDFGRVADLSVGVLLALEAGLARRVVLTVELRGVPGEEQKTAVGRILEAARPRLVGAAFDATGPGLLLAEDLGRRFGLAEGEGAGGLVRPVRLSEDWYRRHMPPLKAAFEDGMIALPRDEQHLADLRALRLLRGVPRLPDLRSGPQGARRHGDFAIALALAHFASRLRGAEYAWQPVAAGSAPEPGRLADLPSEEAPRRGWWRGPLGARLRGGLWG